MHHGIILHQQYNLTNTQYNQNRLFDIHPLALMAAAGVTMEKRQDNLLPKSKIASGRLGRPSGWAYPCACPNPQLQSTLV